MYSTGEIVKSFSIGENSTLNGMDYFGIFDQHLNFNTPYYNILHKKMHFYKYFHYNIYNFVLLP